MLQQFRTMASGMPPGPERTQLERNIDQLQKWTSGTCARSNSERSWSSESGLGVSGRRQFGSPQDDAQTAQAESAGRRPAGAPIRREVKEALIESMLESTQPFDLKPDEWFTIIARDGAPSQPALTGRLD